MIPSVELPPEGRYPTPDHRRDHVVERRWDGEVWLADISPAPDGVTLPPYKRHVLGFLRHWKLLLAFVVFAAITIALWAGDRHAHWVSGAQIVMPLCSLLGTAVVMLALISFLNRRVGLDRISRERRMEILRWGVLSGIVGFAFAIAIEIGLPELLGSDFKDRGWSALAGPAEETGKLLIPVVLWNVGRFRVPREGYLLVLVSAACFGMMESFEYALNPDRWQVQRIVLEIMHPLLTGFVAAVAWQVAWKGRSLFTGAAIGAWIVAMVAHSTNDVMVLDHTDGRIGNALGVITIVVVIGMYLLQKHSARQLVPPDKVGVVSPHWRPAAPRHAVVVAPAVQAPPVEVAQLAA